MSQPAMFTVGETLVEVEIAPGSRISDDEPSFIVHHDGETWRVSAQMLLERYTPVSDTAQHYTDAIRPGQSDTKTVPNSGTGSDSDRQ